MIRKIVVLLVLISLMLTTGCAFRNTRFREDRMIGRYISLQNHEVVLNLCGCGRATVAKPNTVIYFDNWDTAISTGTMRLDVLEDKKFKESIIVEYNMDDDLLILTLLYDTDIFDMISDDSGEGMEFLFAMFEDVNPHRNVKCSP